MSDNWKKLENYFNASSEDLIRSTYTGVEKDHIYHYESRMNKLLSDPNIKIILDLGCGDGKVLREFALKYPEKKFIGYDLSGKNIEMAKKKYPLANISYIKGNAANEFDLQEKIDLIYSFSFIQYFDEENSIKLSNNISNILSNKGFVVHMSIPDIKHNYRIMFPEKINLKSIIIFLIKVIKKYFLKQGIKYGKNGFWWSKSKLISHYKSNFSEVSYLSSDSWYRFDIIARK